MKRFGRTIISAPAVREFAYEAKLSGSDHSDRSGNCSNPRMVSFTGLADKALFRLQDWKTNPEVDYAPGHGLTGGWRQPSVRHVDVAVRCRRCPPCLASRARLWRYRARAECAASNRTWFGTLTLAPERQFQCLAEAERRSYSTSNTQLRPQDIFLERIKPVVAEWQRYMKRLRKDAPGLRYVLVVEKHKTGLPHLHCLIHETGPPILHKTLQAQWTWGFTKFNLIQLDDNGKAAAYVCKYLAKEMASRVRASTQYGRL